MKPQREQRKNLKVVHLNASSAGGAFVAAQRLSCALDLLPEVDSTHWVFEGGEGDFFLWADDWLKKKWAFALHALEKLDFLRFEREKAVRFAFSHGKTGVNVSAWEAIADADVIHLHWVNKGFIGLNGLEALLKLNKRVVWTCHDMWPFTGGCYHPRGCDHFQAGCGNCHYLKSPADGDLSRRVFSAKQRMYQSHGGHLQFVTPSQWLKDQALKSGALTTNLRHGIQVIPNPIDTDYFYPAIIDISGIEGIAKEGIAKEGIVIEGIANQGLGNEVGQGESGRGHIDRDDKAVSKTFTLMFAAANLGNAAKGFAEFRVICNSLYEMGFTHLHALVVGENRLGDLGLKCTFTELGFVADAQRMRDAYWQADVYVTTSHEENLPTTIMESLSCGVPVAAFAVGGIPEMIESTDGRNTGWLAPKMDTQTLIDGIADYINESFEIRSEISSRCRSFAIERYAASGVAKKYLEVYSN
ncbi:MAG: glycosyltransferase [Bacteroidota bacterium]